MKTILSLGVGINSTALLLEWTFRKLPLDYVIFADTGSEKPQTYAYLEKYVKPFCLEQRLPLIEIRRAEKTRTGNLSWPLHRYYENGNSIPFRNRRETTRDWKIRPMQKWIKKNARPARVLIGFDFGEVGRVNDQGPNEAPWITKSYPLIEWKIRRPQCEEVIRRQGWPSPGKSGCWCCPFTSLVNWQLLKVQNPDLFERAARMEERARMAKADDRIQFHTSGTLRDLEKGRLNNRTLDNFEQEECGGCFT